MPVARDGEKMNVIPIEKYGLSPAHAVHLEGITTRATGIDEHVVGSLDHGPLHAAH